MKKKKNLAVPKASGRSLLPDSNSLIAATRSEDRRSCCGWIPS
jgi:hypothetical protein